MIGDVRGKGLFCGIELVLNRETKEPVDEAVAIQIVNACKEAGLLIGRTNRSFETFNNILNMSPALCITAEQIEDILNILDRVFAKVTL